jgi:hypothetical protein
VKVRCVECRHFSLKAVGELAREGFGRCACDIDRYAARFPSATFPRDCGNHSPAPATDAGQRIQWLTNLQAERLARYQPMTAAAKERP